MYRNSLPLPARIKEALALTRSSFACWRLASRAEGSHLLSIGVRARIGGERVLGEEQPEAFHEYDAVASIGFRGNALPVRLGVGTRLLASAGVLQGRTKQGLVFSLILFSRSVVKMTFVFDLGGRSGAADQACFRQARLWRPLAVRVDGRCRNSALTDGSVLVTAFCITRTPGFTAKHHRSGLSHGRADLPLLTRPCFPAVLLLILALLRSADVAARSRCIPCFVCESELYVQPRQQRTRAILRRRGISRQRNRGRVCTLRLKHHADRH